MTIPQIGGMYHGDFSRKQKLVEYGFQLPSALDNRPLKPDEFESDRANNLRICNPGKLELEKSAVIKSN